MKQKSLYRFSKNAVKGGYTEIFMPVLFIALVYLIQTAFCIAGAYFLCKYYFTAMAVLIWCGVRVIIKMFSVLLTLRSRVNIIRRCIIRISLPCGYERGIRKRLKRLYFLRGSINFLSRVLLAAVFLLGVWIINTDSFPFGSIYRLFAAFQTLPAMLVIMWFRMRLYICFVGAEVLTVENPSVGAWRNFRESCKMLSDQHKFITGMFFRNFFNILLPVFLPRFIQTFISYFSVRHIEWTYERKKEELQSEQYDIHGGHRKPYEAGGVFAA